MNPLKTLLSTFVRSRVFTGLIVLVLGSLTMLPAVPTLDVRPDIPALALQAVHAFPCCNKEDTFT